MQMSTEMATMGVQADLRRYSTIIVLPYQIHFHMYSMYLDIPTKQKENQEKKYNRLSISLFFIKRENILILLNIVHFQHGLLFHNFIVS